MIRRICQRHGVPIRRVDRLGILAGIPGIAGHVDVPDPDNPALGGGDSNHTDPGLFFPWDRFLALVGNAEDPSGDASPLSTLNGDTPVQFGPFGAHFGGGFRRFWEERGGLAIFGFPLTEESQENGVTVQYFERARFEHRPDIGKAEDYHVVLGRVGAELLKTREELQRLLQARNEAQAQELEHVAALLARLIEGLRDVGSRLQAIVTTGERLLKGLEQEKEAA